MAATLTAPLVSTVDSTRYVRSLDHPRLNQYQRSGPRASTRRPFPLPHIPSERLDSRSESSGPKMGGYGNVRIVEEQSSPDHIDGAISVTNTSITAPSATPLKASKRERITTNDSSPREDSCYQSTGPSQSRGTITCDQANAPKMAPESWFRNGGRRVITGVLVPLPYILTSPLHTSLAASSPLSASNLAIPAISELTSSLCLGLTLTAITLAILAASGRYTRGRRRLPGPQPGIASADENGKSRVINLNIPTCLRIVQRTIDLALPYTVALRFNGLMVSLLLLVKVSSGLFSFDRQTFPLSHVHGWKRLLVQKSWALGALCLICLTTFKYGSGSQVSSWTDMAMVAVLAVFCSPPYSYSTIAVYESSLASLHPATESRFTVPVAASRNEDRFSTSAPQEGASAPLTRLAEDITLNLISAGFAAVVAGLLCLQNGLPIKLLGSAGIVILVPFLSAWSILGIEVVPSPILLASGCSAAFIGNLLAPSSSPSVWRDAIITALAFTAVQLDARKPSSSSELPVSSTNSKNIKPNNRRVSAPTKLLLQSTERHSILHGILADKESRRIFYFMLLNLCFMLVQSTYGVLTGSLGLISDSIHMFFDCVALLVGLCAAVMSKWPPSMKYPYGYGKIDTLSGFGNGIFLMLISIEIIWEAVERLIGGSDLSRTTELLVVSILGLLVNLVGIMAFEHGHAHGHDHGHSHGHSHAGHHHGHTEHSPQHQGHGRSHSHSSTSSALEAKSQKSGHHHGGDNMHGIYLHILADTLGSGAVVLSTLCVQYTGWSGFDPLASCAIAILIFASSVPLIISCGKKMLLSLPSDVEYTLRDTLAGVSTIRGVVAYTVPKFWLDDIGKKSLDSDHQEGHHHGHSCSDHHSQHDEKHSHTHPHSDSHSHSHSHSHAPFEDSGSKHHDHSEITEETPLILGVIHIIAAPYAELEDVRARVVNYLRSKNMDILVQVERDGDSRCWCSSAKSS